MMEGFLLLHYVNLGKDSFERHGSQRGYPSRVFLRKEEETEMIDALDKLPERKIPYVRRDWTKNTRIRTVVKEEPVRLTQYIRGKTQDFCPTNLQSVR